MSGNTKRDRRGSGRTDRPIGGQVSGASDPSPKAATGRAVHIGAIVPDAVANPPSDAERAAAAAARALARWENEGGRVVSTIRRPHG